jgi:hypothetical protein
MAASPRHPGVERARLRRVGWQRRGGHGGRCGRRGGQARPADDIDLEEYAAALGDGCAWRRGSASSPTRGTARPVARARTAHCRARRADRSAARRPAAGRPSDARPPSPPSCDGAAAGRGHPRAGAGAPDRSPPARPGRPLAEPSRGLPRYVPGGRQPRSDVRLVVVVASTGGSAGPAHRARGTASRLWPLPCWSCSTWRRLHPRAGQLARRAGGADRPRGLRR